MQVQAFYLLRAACGTVSGLCEAIFCHALSLSFGRRAPHTRLKSS